VALCRNAPRPAHFAIIAPASPPRLRCQRRFTQAAARTHPAWRGMSAARRKTARHVIFTVADAAGGARGVRRAARRDGARRCHASAATKATLRREGTMRRVEKRLAHAPPASHHALTQATRHATTLPFYRDMPRMHGECLKTFTAGGVALFSRRAVYGAFMR